MSNRSPPETTAPLVVVRPAVRNEQSLIEGLFQFYLYDWSEMEPVGSVDFDFNAQGQFRPDPYLATYWSAERRWPLLIQLGERTIGFALLNTHSHGGGEIERNMADFFVVRQHRRQGLAAAAVRRILALHPGQWEVAVAERNVVAKAFWPKALAAANVTGLHAVEGDGEHWRGPIWRFHVGALDAPDAAKPIE